MLRGKRGMDVSEAVALARLLGVSVDDVLERTGEDLRGVRGASDHGAGAGVGRFKFCPHCGERLEN